jgi:endonuclease G
LCRIGYVVSYNRVRKNPDWVAWHLTSARATGCRTRKSIFAVDKELPVGQRAELADYKGSFYDRGHMAPNADFLWSLEAQRQSSLLSNMTPQIHSFNAGVWGRVEAMTRVWATDREEVYVVDGPLYEGQPINAIGKDKVAVPTHFFKIVYDPKAKEALAFVFPHGQIKASAVAHFQMSVRDVEKRAGLDFFAALTMSDQDQIETATTTIWPADRGAWEKARKKKCS